MSMLIAVTLKRLQGHEKARLFLGRTTVGFCFLFLGWILHDQAFNSHLQALPLHLSMPTSVALNRLQSHERAWFYMYIYLSIFGRFLYNQAFQPNFSDFASLPVLANFGYLKTSSKPRESPKEKG